MQSLTQPFDPKLFNFNKINPEEASACIHLFQLLSLSQLVSLYLPSRFYFRCRDHQDQNRDASQRYTILGSVLLLLAIQAVFQQFCNICTVSEQSLKVVSQSRSELDWWSEEQMLQECRKLQCYQHHTPLFMHRIRGMT